MNDTRHLNEARRYIDRKMARESKDPDTLRHIALCYIDAFEKALTVIAIPRRQMVNWREEIPDL